MKNVDEGGIIAYGEGIADTLLNNGLADKIVMITLLTIAGGGEKVLPGVTAESAAWVVRSCKLLDGEKVRTVYGRV